MTTNNRETLLPVAEIVAQWPISRPTVYRQLRLGRFPEPVAVGGRRYWRRCDVESYFSPRSRHAASAQRG